MHPIAAPERPAGRETVHFSRRASSGHWRGRFMTTTTAVCSDI
jgi:hypothetical protein